MGYQHQRLTGEALQPAPATRRRFLVGVVGGVGRAVAAAGGGGRAPAPGPPPGGGAPPPPQLPEQLYNTTIHNFKQNHKGLMSNAADLRPKNTGNLSLPPGQKK